MRKMFFEEINENSTNQGLASIWYFGNLITFVY